MKYRKPKKLPSANIKAEIYRLLRDNNIQCCLDYRLATEYGELATLSIVVIQDDEIVCAIIVRSMNSNDGLNTNTNRFRKYDSFGIDLFECTRMDQVPSVVDQVIAWIK